MNAHYLPGLFDRLLAEQPGAASGIDKAHWTLDEFKDSVALALENLFNTRAAMPDKLLAGYPEVRSSIVNYGLIDFAAMCLSSDADRKKICAALELAIARNEPRLYAVSATLRSDEAHANRVEFVINAQLRMADTGEPVQFDGILRPSTQQYAVRKSKASGEGDGGR